MQFWRQTGFSYLKYANLCARTLRRSLKEPFRTKALERDNSAFVTSEWSNGKFKKGLSKPADQMMGL